MAEIFPLDERRAHLTPEEREDLAVYEYVTDASAEGLQDRWGVYKYAKERMNYYFDAYEELQCGPNATILDVGSSDGRGMQFRRITHKHQGLLIGVDIDKRVFGEGVEKNAILEEIGWEPIQFLAARGEDLPLEDKTVDGALAILMVYHSAKPRKIIEELARVTKDDGRIVIVTSGPENKFMQRRFEYIVSNHLGIKPPPYFSESFDTEVAETMLPDILNIVKVRTQRCKAIILNPVHDNGESYECLIDSLNSMRKHCKPEPNEDQWNEAVDELVKPFIEKEFEEKGYFTEEVDRKMYVCETKKLT